MWKHITEGPQTFCIKDLDGLNFVVIIMMIITIITIIFHCFLLLSRNTKCLLLSMTFLYFVTISKFLQAEVWMVISPPSASKSSKWSPGVLFFSSHYIVFFNPKKSISLTNHKILPRLPATVSDLKEQSPRKKRLTGWLSFPFRIWLMYCIAYMFTECICLVMSTHWRTKKKKFWCAIGYLP